MTFRTTRIGRAIPWVHFGIAKFTVFTNHQLNHLRKMGRMLVLPLDGSARQSNNICRSLGIVEVLRLQKSSIKTLNALIAFTTPKVASLVVVSIII
jgi:hypothetical protein